MSNDDKKNEDLRPTNTDYLDDAKMTCGRATYISQAR